MIDLKEFRAWNAQFEGSVNWMYLDIKGLVTSGVGNLMDPMIEALKWPWRNADGSIANGDDIIAEWQLVKAHQELAHQGARAAKAYTKLHILDEAVTDLCVERAEGILAYLRQQPPYTQIDTWPAQAQLAILSMCWAAGEGAISRDFPHFARACALQKWHSAAFECLLDETGNPGLKPRNKANVALFQDAAQAAALLNNLTEKAENERNKRTS